MFNSNQRETEELKKIVFEVTSFTLLTKERQTKKNTTYNKMMLMLNGHTNDIACR